MHRTALPLLAAVLAAPVGCQSAPAGGPGDAAASTPSTADAVASSSSDAAPRGSQRTYDASLDALVAAIPFALEAMHWGQMKLTREGDTLHAAAVIDNDRVATVTAHPAADAPDHVTVTVAIGRFNHDPAGERAFLDRLPIHIERYYAKQRGR